MKVLVTSGCSFSTTIHHNYLCWPYHLSEHYKAQLINKAMGSQGNGLISRGIIHAVCNLLKTHKPEDLFVGVMWSGCNRKDYYWANHDTLSFYNSKEHLGWIENPTGFIDGHDKNWVILNQHWASSIYGFEEAKYHYKFFYDPVGMQIETIEHMLRTQYFLQNKGVRYFFSLFQDHVLDDELVNHIDVKTLYELIDFGHFLPIRSFYTYLVDNKIYTEDFVEQHPNNHPSVRQNIEFVKNIIIPYIYTYEHNFDR